MSLLELVEIFSYFVSRRRSRAERHRERERRRKFWAQCHFDQCTRVNNRLQTVAKYPILLQSASFTWNKMTRFTRDTVHFAIILFTNRADPCERRVDVPAHLHVRWCVCSFEQMRQWEWRFAKKKKSRQTEHRDATHTLVRCELPAECYPHSAQQSAFPPHPVPTTNRHSPRLLPMLSALGARSMITTHF